MVRFFCPACWTDFPDDLPECPKCGLDIAGFLSSKDYVERLILALAHPEKATPVRAAWILGKLRTPRAVPHLIALIEKTKDVYVAIASINALAEIGTDEAVRFLRTLLDHTARTIRESALGALEDETASSSALADQDNQTGSTWPR